MKKVLLLLSSAVIFSGCSYFQNNGSQTDVAPTPSPTVSISQEHVLDGNITNLLIREQNFGTDEITVLKDELLILSVRNQLEEPVNVVIDELGIKTDPIEFGQVVEITVPTNKPGEYEMYSSLGNQRSQGFSTVIIVDEGSLEEE